MVGYITRLTEYVIGTLEGRVRVVGIRPGRQRDEVGDWLMLGPGGGGVVGIT